MLRSKFDLRSQDSFLDVMGSECLKLAWFVQGASVFGDLDIRDYKCSIEDLHETHS